MNFVAINLHHARNPSAPPATSAPKPPRSVLPIVVMIAAASVLNACAPPGGDAAMIAGLESALTAAERAALGYTSLPRCPQRSPP